MHLLMKPAPLCEGEIPFRDYDGGWDSFPCGNLATHVVTEEVDPHALFPRPTELGPKLMQTKVCAICLVDLSTEAAAPWTISIQSQPLDLDAYQS